jgi:hypothetical protein
MQPAPTHWGLTLYEWLTIAAIVLGPVLAVATQLWFQARKTKRDSKAWVFNTLIGLRPQILHVDFLRAFNMIDVVFYDNEGIRQGRKDFLSVVTAAAARDMTQPELNKCNDLLAEMLAKMGRELGYEFDHTEIKDTGYYPKGIGEPQMTLLAILKNGLALLEGKQTIAVAIREASATPPAAATPAPAAPVVRR